MRPGNMAVGRPLPGNAESSRRWRALKKTLAVSGFLSDIRLQVVNTSREQLIKLITRTREQFCFKYVGGGYFRDKQVAKGQKAEVRHGEEIIDEFCEELVKNVTGSE